MIKIKNSAKYIFEAPEQDTRIDIDDRELT